MGERSRRHLRGSRVWRTGHRRSGPTGASLVEAKGSIGRTWMKISASRGYWRGADLARRRNLFSGGSSGGGRKRGGGGPFRGGIIFWFCGPPAPPPTPAAFFSFQKDSRASS